MLQKNTIHPLFWCYFQDIFSLKLWYYHHVSAAPHVSKGNQKRHLSKQSPPKAHARFQKTVWSTQDWLSCVVFSNIISLEQAEKQLHHWFKPRKVLLNHTLCAFGGRVYGWIIVEMRHPRIQLQTSWDYLELVSLLIFSCQMLPFRWRHPAQQANKHRGIWFLFLFWTMRFWC